MSVTAPSRVLNSIGLERTSQEFSALFVALALMQASDTLKDTASAAITAVVNTLTPGDDDAQITALNAVVASLSTTDQLLNPFAEVLRRLSAFGESKFVKQTAILFGTRVSR